jgi:hypothetical protein
MSTIEERLHELRDGAVPPPPSVDHLRRRTSRRRRRWAGSTTLAVALLAGAVAALWPEDGGRGQVVITNQPTTTTPDPTSPRGVTPPVPIALASAKGVVLVLADGRTTLVSDEPAAIAYALGDDLVVFKNARAGDPVSLDSEEPVRVWADGKTTVLPAGRASTRIRLLDLGVVDGAPTALVAETNLGALPPDTFEELLAIDVRTGARSLIVRRDGWETGHVSARFLPGGDVVGVIQSNVTLDLVRWSAGRPDPVWSVRIGEDEDTHVTLRDGEIVTVQFANGPSPEFTPVLTLTPHDATTGAPGLVATSELAKGDRAISPRSCLDWLSPVELACAQYSGAPLTIYVDRGTVAALQGDPEAIPTVVREPAT